MITILVDQDLCTRCGICSLICPMSIVDPADENILPKVHDSKAGMCIRCGHCEVSCPSQALLLNIRLDEKVQIPATAGNLSADDLGVYMKKRRSVRHFTKDPGRKSCSSSILPGTPPPVATGSRCSGLSYTTRIRSIRLLG
jgi:formate hydrogenlyase subunit 6/NADH:ubiquinone oxidoreductase subunit I